MNTLHDLPNISNVIEGKLMEVGINTPQMLIDLGSQAAFERLKLKDSTACLSMLYALEGAIEGIRWHYLSPDKKQECKAFYKTL